MRDNANIKNEAIYNEDEFDENQEDTQENKYLTFYLNNEEFGIEIKYIIEIIGIQLINTVPDMPAYIKGVINLRGKVIPVMDVRMRFKFNEKPYNERTCIIVTRINEQLIGLIVDEVSEVLDIPKSNIEPPPKINGIGGVDEKVIHGLGKVGSSVKIILNVNKLLFEKEIEDMFVAE